MIRKIGKIRTGGQSGVDRAAMDMARKYNVPICGWCPKGGWAEDMPEAPGLLKEYPELVETPSEGTAQRNRWNMRDADAIMTIIPKESAESKGTDVGVEEGISLGKPMCTIAGIEDIDIVIEWLSELPDGIELAVGGPRASECAEAYKITSHFLQRVFEKLI